MAIASINNPKRGEPQEVALNNVYRLLQSFRRDAFFGHEASVAHRSQSADEKLTSIFPVERNVREVRLALDRAINIVFPRSERMTQSKRSNEYCDLRRILSHKTLQATRTESKSSPFLRFWLGPDRLSALMTPYEFLTQQVVNVEQALTETLRYEYGPAPDWGYYNECSDRLSRIKIAITGTSTTDTASIAARLDELADLSVWISFIECSRLGEFSWPFAEALRKMANALLSDRGLSGKPISPIVHIIADGEGYFIHPERTSASGNHKFAIIAFPRPLKHHVLLHSIFGHELGIAPCIQLGPGIELQNKVMTALQSAGPLHNENSITSWLRDNTGPPQVRDILDQYNADFEMQYEFPQEYLLDWLEELICDLFGLLLFGPGFAAAYRTYLRPMQANPYEVGLRN